ncbi:MAG: DUF2939 domain-containing protein [Proteobacteria bacterium]|nr:DUF2939 domain-containing protein [Pseudomonadota bacterium]
MHPDDRRDPRLTTRFDPFPETRRDGIPLHQKPARRGKGLPGLWLLAGAAVLSLIAAALCFGPHWTVYRMRSAIEHKDARELSSYVDYPSLRESLKVQLLMLFDRETGASSGKQAPIAALGQVLVVGMTNAVVDALVTPAGVMAMMEEGRVKTPATGAPPPTTPGGKSPGPEPPKDPQQPSWHAPKYRLQYVDFSTVRLTAADDTSGAFVLQRRNLFQWKLAEVVLPMPEPKTTGKPGR